VATVVALALVTTACGVTRVSVSSGGTQGNGTSTLASGVTDDGRYVVFDSLAGNLVAGDTNGTWDTFRRDEVTKTTVRVSVSSTGGQLATGGEATPGVMSANGRLVLFASDTTADPADTHVGEDAYLRDVTAGTTTWVSPPPAGGFPFEANVYDPAISADGRYVSFRIVSFAAGYLYRFDRQTGVTTQLFGPYQFNDVHSSRDGRHYALVPQCPTIDDCGSRATLVDADGSGDGWPALQFPICRFDYFTAISPDGRYVFFHAAAGFSTEPCLARGGYLVDRATGVATNANLPGNGDATAISPGARSLLFFAGGSVLPGGPPSRGPGRDSHLYLRNRLQGNDVREDFTVAGQVANDQVTGAVLSDDGTSVALTSSATNIVADDTNAVDDVFVHATGIPPSG
jgi:hypothetical protein